MTRLQQLAERFYQVQSGSLVLDPEVTFQPFSLQSLSPSRILVSHLDHIGDIVCTTPVCEQIKKRYPEAELIYLTGEPFLELLEDNPHIDQVMAIATQPETLIDRVTDLNQRRISLYINLGQNVQSAILAGMIQADYYIGSRFVSENHMVTYGNWWTLYWSVQHVDLFKKPATMLDYSYQKREYLKLGFELSDEQTFVTVSDQIADTAQKKLVRLGWQPNLSLVGLNPDCNRHMRQWGDERFIQCAASLIKAGYQVVMFSSREKSDYYTTLIRQSDLPILNATNIPLKIWKGMIKHCRLLITNDTGGLHLAAGLGIKTISIFGPSWPVQALPEYDGVYAVQSDLKCSPCFNMEHCHYTVKHACMKKIGPEFIATMAVAILNQAPLPHQKGIRIFPGSRKINDSQEFYKYLLFDIIRDKNRKSSLTEDTLVPLHQPMHDPPTEVSPFFKGLFFLNQIGLFGWNTPLSPSDHQAVLEQTREDIRFALGKR